MTATTGNLNNASIAEEILRFLLSLKNVALIWITKMTKSILSNHTIIRGETLSHILSKEEWDNSKQAHNGETLLRDNSFAIKMGYTDALPKTWRVGYIFVPVDKPWKHEVKKVIIII